MVMQTWPSEEAYRAQIQMENDREALIRKHSAEKCHHGVSMTSGCDECGDEAELCETVVQDVEAHRLTLEYRDRRFVWHGGEYVEIYRLGADEPYEVSNTDMNVPGKQEFPPFTPLSLVIDARTWLGEI